MLIDIHGNQSGFEKKHIIVNGKNMTTHDTHLQNGTDWPQTHQAKCVFRQPELCFLDPTVESRLTLVNVKAISQLQEPTNVHELK